jgi:hypothetical protein
MSDFKSPLGKDLKNKDLLSHKRRGLSSFLVSSFFGALMVAGTFAYFNYKFSEYQFLNFSEWNFYTKNDIFSPKEDRYLVIIYSSRDQLSIKEIQKIETKTPIILIDFYQDINKNAFVINSKNFNFIKTGTNTFLKVAQRFNIYETPTLFFIKKIRENLYKQDSTVQKLRDFDFKEEQSE